ncbi:Lipoprotein-releasing system transmembrane protein LolE [Emticicia aquatica]|uniref:Lipoprotein-releasing system transmembrane protein LolE n=1 Tax=Emticicia aquatica TaxID=1681835 RepID=A0ABN8EQZ0_9BACT|nr:FtsX-like permease family protein [Emticicia aquatica]CAH0995308.1 Lipoprotein-releasing system transmembrane protein LolE [Emticicia aquatica]
MNLPRFIAQRIQKTNTTTFTSTVTKIGISSITIGLAVMIISFSILIGFKRTIRDKLFSLSSHIQVSKITLNQSFEETPMPINTKFYQNYRKNPKIRHVQAVANKAGLLKSSEEHTGIVIKGVGKDYDWASFSENLVEGRKINSNDSTYSTEIIISKKIATQLKIKLSDEVMIYFIQNPPRIRKVKVVGIYDTGLEEFDKNFILGDLALVQRMNDWNEETAGHYEVFLNDFDQLDIVSRQVFDDIDQDMQLLKVTEMFPAIFDWLNLMDRNIFVIIALILVVASFNMISVLLVMMMERTPMIGLLKALGSDNAKIRKIFIFNGLTIIIKGIIYGNIIGIGFCYLQYLFKVIPLDSESYYMNYVPISFNWLTILIINIVTIVLVLGVITIPTFVISRMKLVESLKFKS